MQLHSDQGFQYTSQAYFNLTQSYDNALAENFFFILKTECIHRVKLSGYDEARLIISEYINFYNNYRIQTKTKLTPLEKRNQFVAYNFLLHVGFFCTACTIWAIQERKRF